MLPLNIEQLTSEIPIQLRRFANPDTKGHRMVDRRTLESPSVHPDLGA